ncbi:alpha/beta fold hydrolase [Nocardia nova]|uniref:alpha/beta fold hydrolase n=1 Tax=Nocardia nova TaxID=37330 RepID=UPI0034017552
MDVNWRGSTVESKAGDRRRARRSRPNPEFAHGQLAPGLLRNPEHAFETTMVETADGARLHVREYGPATAPRIVLIHGYACRIEYWNPQINQLADHYRVIVPDLRGHGRSSQGELPFSVALAGSDLSAVLAATVPPGSRAVLAGHSLGGITIMSWAAQFPEEVHRYARSVALISTVAERFAAHTLLLPFAGDRRVRREQLIDSLLGRLPIPDPRLLGPAFGFTALSRAATRDQVRFTASLAATCANPFRSRVLSFLRQIDVTDGLANLTVPTTVIVGAADRLTPPSASRRIVDLISHTGNRPRYVEVPRHGHCVNLEDPDTVTAEIERMAALEHRSAG